MIDIDFHKHFNGNIASQTYNLRGHNFKLQRSKYSGSEVRNRFFCERVIQIWNDLPKEIVESPNIYNLKKELDKFNLNSIYTSKVWVKSACYQCFSLFLPFTILFLSSSLSVSSPAGLGSGISSPYLLTSYQVIVPFWRSVLLHFGVFVVSPQCLLLFDLFMLYCTCNIIRKKYKKIYI